MTKLTYRMTNALRNLMQETLYKLELDEIAPCRSKEDAEDCAHKHMDAVRAVEAIDIIIGGVPTDRNYEGLRWSAVSSLNQMERERAEELVANAARMENEI